MASQEEMTPCGAMFDILKRSAHISHLDLCEMVLSSRPLSEGRSPVSRAKDRSWVSRYIVHAPVGTLQERYFCDYGIAATRILSRLRSARVNRMSETEVIDMICGPDGEPLERALAACHQDVNLYRNALQRLSNAEGMGLYERAESVVALFVAAGCSANVRLAVTYALDYAHTACGGGTSTPLHVAAAGLREGAEEGASPLGLMPVSGGYVTGDPHWVEPTEDGIELGALCVGDGDITDVGADVSARHARLWCDEQGCWWVMDLGSTNGTSVESGATGEVSELAPNVAARLEAGDLLRLGGTTTFAVMSGLPSARG